MKIMELLREKKILISDGAWGTFLQQKGLKPGECPEQWNIDHPEEVFAIADSYIKAGADLIETNSFGGSPHKLEQYGLADKCQELNYAAAQISRQAADTTHGVLGSIGPTGKILMMGDVSEEELYEGFREQANALEAGGVDAICIETMAALDEALIAIRAARDNTNLEIICTMTFEKTKSGEYRTMMGVSPTEMYEAFTAAEVDIIGSNCGNGMAGMVDITAEIRRIDSSIPILIHANAGLPQYLNGQTIFPETPQMIADQVKILLNAGANIIGGCCGTTPEHIEAMRTVLNGVLK